jgi:hypothetical protein
VRQLRVGMAIAQRKPRYDFHGDAMAHALIDSNIHARIRAEYREMPGMSLTTAQAARLFDLELVSCARVLDALVTDGILWTNGREFLGSNAGRRSA